MRIRAAGHFGKFGNFGNRYEARIPFLDGTHKHILQKILLFCIV